MDSIFKALASVRLTFFIFFSLLFLSIPGTLILQYNISNVDPGLQYSYDFWKWGQTLQLFSAYHSFWYVGLITILAMNLIACSTLRWPPMFRIAIQEPVAWAKARFDEHPEELRFQWRTKLSKEKFIEKIQAELKQGWLRPKILVDKTAEAQIFWQTGRWSRLANVLVHSALLVIFLGAIISSMYGFEGGANIPERQAVDTFVLFKEGKASGLVKPPQSPVAAERFLGFRLENQQFDVEYYKDFPGRPKNFMTKLNVIDHGRLEKTADIQVNSPMKYNNFVFYQASFGRMGNYDIDLSILDKESSAPVVNQVSEIGAINPDYVKNLTQQIYWASTGVKVGANYTTRPFYLGSVIANDSTDTVPRTVIEAIANSPAAPFEPKAITPADIELAKADLLRLHQFGVDLAQLKRDVIYPDGLKAFDGSDKKSLALLDAAYTTVNTARSEARLNATPTFTIALPQLNLKPITSETRSGVLRAFTSHDGEAAILAEDFVMRGGLAFARTLFNGSVVVLTTNPKIKALVEAYNKQFLNQSPILVADSVKTARAAIRNQSAQEVAGVTAGFYKERAVLGENDSDEIRAELIRELGRPQVTVFQQGQIDRMASSLGVADVVAKLVASLATAKAA